MKKRQNTSVQPNIKCDVESAPIITSTKSDMFRRRQSMKSYQSRSKPMIICVALCAILFFTTLALLYRNSSKDIFLSEEVTLLELKNARDLLLQAKQQPLEKLRQIDREKYTVRINTWRRNDQLIAAVNHYLTCPNIAQIQIVWCDGANQPPMQLFEHNDKHVSVVVERHSINSLNERFHILPDTYRGMPTLGILSVDDDVLRSCEAINSGFYHWTDHPDRIVGFDFRVHMASNHSRDDRIDRNPIWSYGYLSSTQKRNQYSITLPRFCFIHRHYLNLYMEYAPTRIIKTVGDHFNCEDIAMSFFVSALTNGNVPLLADFWASMPSMVKLDSEHAISETDNHKIIRDECVDKFGFLLGLKDGYELLEGTAGRKLWGSFSSKQTIYRSIFGMGDNVDTQAFEIRDDFVQSRKDFTNNILSWKDNSEKTGQKIPFQNLKDDLHNQMKTFGLIKH